MNISLSELEPKFIRVEVKEEEFTRLKAGVDPLNWTDADTEKVTGPRIHHVPVMSLAEAHGVMFLCPKCFMENGGRVGTHGVIVGFRDRDAPPGSLSINSSGQDSRWAASGSGINDLTLDPSILLSGGCGWHGFVRNGRVTES